MLKTVQDFQDGRQFSSVVEQLIRNEQVVGSSPTTGSIFAKKFVDFFDPFDPSVGPPPILGFLPRTKHGQV